MLFFNSALLLLGLFGAANASPLAYPEHTNLDADEVAAQVFHVLRAKTSLNAISKKSKGKMARLINRRPGRKASVNSFESYINNDYKDGVVEQKQLAIFRSGKLKGTGILITDYVDQSREPLMQIWLPRLRKVRRFAAPDAQEFWNGSNLTYGEVFLRKLSDESHQLLEHQVFDVCLGTLQLPKSEQSKYTRNLPPEQCAHKGKNVYVLKSSNRLKNAWYDYHIGYIDKQSFAVYRTEYFKNNRLIKTVDIDWQSLFKDDPRIVFPAYLYSKSLLDNSESLFIVPRETVFIDQKIKAKFWSDSALRKIKR